MPDRRERVDRERHGRDSAQEVRGAVKVRGLVEIKGLLNQRPCKNGLRSFSRPMVVFGPWPGITTVSSGKRQQLVVNRAQDLAADRRPADRCVRCCRETACRPRSALFSAGIHREMLPCVWPGVCSTVKFRVAERERHRPRAPHCRSQCARVSPCPARTPARPDDRKVPGRSGSCSTGAPVAALSFAAPPMWSMWAWVMTIAFTCSPCFSRMARMSSILSPGSTTMASRVCSSPKIEQLHCSMPTGRISWIISGRGCGLSIQ